MANRMLPGFDGLRFSHWQADLRGDGVLVLSLDRQGAAVNAFSQDVLLDLGGNLKAASGEWRVGVYCPAGSEHFPDAITLAPATSCDTLIFIR